MRDGGGTYRWHAGAPDDETFARAHAELVARIEERLSALGLEPLRLEPVAPLEQERASSLVGEPESGVGAATSRPNVTDEYVAAAYGEALLDLAEREPRLVVLDADLASDCRVRGFELAHPDRFFETGIAEQDMVSAAAGLARQGLLPVVNSFASFLASRANEQIYNQASEGTKVVYALHYAGLIPAGPGKSHQSLRDASLLAALPGVTVVHPGTPRRRARSSVGRARSGGDRRHPARDRALAAANRASVARRCPGTRHGAARGSGRTVLAYGPVMLHEALNAAELLAADGTSAQVVDMPWLNRIDPDWLADLVAAFTTLCVVEDHAPVGALGDMLRRELDGRPLHVFGVEGWPACGTPAEVLRHHRLDGASLAARVAATLAAATLR